MKIQFPVCAFIVIVTILACNNGEKGSVTNQTVADSLHVKDTINLEAASVKADEYYNDLQYPLDTLTGCWAAIRAGNITISFSKDSTFEFFDYNSKLKENELLTGRFELDGSTLTLFYNDRPKQRFTFKRDPESNDEYRITNSTGYYFLKSNCL